MELTMQRPTQAAPWFRRGVVMVFAAALGVAGLALAETKPVAPLTLAKGEHVAILGNALPDRMQHDGYLETLIHARFPDGDLVFRNLSASGDEVNSWQRSENFGSREEWLKRAGADVIFAFFGYAESFSGEANLPNFKNQVTNFIKDTRAKQFNGKSAPRIVLFSPVADEKHQDPNFPDPAANNARLKLYADAMAEVAAANGVQFVDLFMPSQKLFADAAKNKKSLTINGHYLSEEGDKLLAPEIFRGIFSETAPAGDHEKLRAAIVEKNWQWHQRYRTIDGYNVYGGRSQMSYESGKGGPKILNYTVMQQEMTQRDVMTANRDKVVWAAAQGKTLAIDDSNLPPVTEVKTNEAGQNPDGTFKFLGAQEAIAKMKLAKGCKVNLFASEEKFPELVAPLQMAWDTKGRLWVSVWQNYPERTPTSKVGDSILILEDTDGDGVADKCTHFLDDLNAPTGFQFYKDGILVMEAPDLWYARDTNGDDKADKIDRVLMGMDSADSHHTTNAMSLDPGGAVYLSDGVFHRTQVETSAGDVRNEDACIYRFDPRTAEFERYVPYGFANPHGRVFDYWGNDLITDATGNNTYFAPAFSGHIDYPAKHEGMKEFWNRPSRPCPGTGMLTSRHFPEEFQNNFLNCNVIGFQGIYRVKVSPDGSGLKGETLEDLVSSSDSNFRPTSVDVGPDGAVYFLDWHNPIIGHLQHHLRDPNRDHAHGRIYRITYEGRPLEKPAKIAGQPISALLELLKDEQNQTRELAKIELGKLDSGKVIVGVNKWIAGLDKKDPAYEHHMTEALWVHQWHNVVDAELLKRMLRSPDANARAAATRVLCYWRDRVSSPLALLKVQANDESPRVRLEAVRAASFFRDGLAVDVALESLKKPSDYYLGYVLKETMKQLDPFWRKGLADGAPIAAENPAGIDYLIKSVTTADLLKLPRTPGTLQAILMRGDVPSLTRNEALAELAKQRKTTPIEVVLLTLESPASAAGAGPLATLLPLQPAAELKAVRPRLLALASSGTSADVRHNAWASVVAADANANAAWDAASAASPGALADLIAALPLVLDPAIRNTAYTRVKPLVASQSAGDALEPSKKKPAAAMGRFVRVQLPRQGTLSLAEVQVFSDGKNIAVGHKTSQSSTGYGGDPARAVDGNTDGAYSSGTITHTNENTENPWWEVDLGGENPIESVVVWNRTDSNGQFASRLDGFVVTVLDTNRKELFKSPATPAPAESAKITIGNDTAGSSRRAAIRAIASMTANQPQTFAALTQLIVDRDQVTVAAKGLRLLPRAGWDEAQAAVAAKSLTEWAKSVPTTERTQQEYIETVQFAAELAGVLPADQASALRAQLREVQVAVFVINTVREQMRYDTPRVVVEAGKPLEMIVVNADFMPHNLAVVKPNTRVALATTAAAMKPDQLDAQGRAYMPNSPDILAGTKLIEAGQKETLKVVAPTVEGEYEYFCTFPGHGFIMYGQLVVTKNVDAYLKDHPNAPAQPGAPTSK
jgi:glucose/arabinose dehydrogenase/azurin